MSQELVTVKTVAKRFNFNCICGKEGLKRPILVENINRAGMELMGFFEHSDLRRIVVFGNKEINYILSHTYEELKDAYDFLVNEITPCIIITQGNSCPKDLKEIAEKRNFPILLGDASTNNTIIELMYYLNELMAPKTSMHATLLEIYGRGVLITGASGILRIKFIQWANDSVLSPYINSFKPINNGSFDVKFNKIKLTF